MKYSFQEQEKIAKRNPAFLKIIDCDIFESIQEDIINKSILNIQFIKNPTEKVQKIVVNKNPIFIKYIKNPSEEASILAVSKSSHVIVYIKNPTEKTQEIAINDSYKNISLIDKPTLKIKLMAIKSNIRALQLIEEKELLSEAIREQLIEENPFLIKSMKTPSQELITKAILLEPKENGILINMLDVTNQLIVLTKHPELYKKISTNKNNFLIQKHIIDIDSCLIKYIENPSEEIQLLAIKKDIDSIEFIQEGNITDKVFLTAKELIEKLILK